MIRDIERIIIFVLIGMILGISIMFFYEGRIEKKLTPSNYVDRYQIEVFSDKFCVYVNNSRVIGYTPTGSMIPILNEYSNGIEIPIRNESDVNVGDIISYNYKKCNKNYSCNDFLVVHRIMKIIKEKNQTYFILKGDGNIMGDGKVKFEDLKYKTIGIIY